ncbi:hypothetical protein Tco_0469054 [Tanacetum coccineum]
MASMGSLPCLNTRIVRPKSSGGNSGESILIETDIVKLVVEIESFGMSADEFDKETGSSDRLQPKQADLSSILHVKLNSLPKFLGDILMLTMHRPSGG